MYSMQCEDSWQSHSLFALLEQEKQLLPTTLHTCSGKEMRSREELASAKPSVKATSHRLKHTKP
ncbi:hypothetical protein DsansV1_C31g0218341 [Dioscorea sansibarensis]